MTRDEAYEFISSKLQNKNLVRHCLAVEAAMKVLAEHFNQDVELWGLAGLLHDADWEATKEKPEKHGTETVEMLKDLNIPSEVRTTILAHNYVHNGTDKPEDDDKMSWSLLCADELTGLIVACALVRPDKRIASVEVDSVLGKFPQKAFAAAIDREKISQCEEKLNLSLKDFIGIVLSAMQTISTEIGL